MNQQKWDRSHGIGRVVNRGSGYNLPKCNHCSKWLRRSEIDKYGRYCFKCGEHMPKEVIEKALHPDLYRRIIAKVDQAERLRQLRAMPYREYLSTKEWKNTRGRAIKRAGKKCEHCGNKYNLDVHHLDYSRLGHEHNADLVVLCHTCHAETHGKKVLQ